MHQTPRCACRTLHVTYDPVRSTVQVSIVPDPARTGVREYEEARRTCAQTIEAMLIEDLQQPYPSNRHHCCVDHIIDTVLSLLSDVCGMDANVTWLPHAQIGQETETVLLVFSPNAPRS